MKILRFIILSILFVCCFSFKQHTKDLVWETASKEEFISASEKAANWFSKNTNYKVDITYSSYSDYSSVNAHDVYAGFYKRQNNNFHTSSMGVLTMQNEKFKISVDTVNRLILLQNKADVNQSPADVKSFSDLLDRVKAIKKQKGENGETGYRIDFNKNDLYSAYEYKVNDKGMLVSMKYFFSKELKDESDEKTIKGKPRLEVVFSNYQTNVNFNYEKEFSEKIYLKEEGKKIILNENYKKFEFKDYRYIKKK